MHLGPLQGAGSSGVKGRREREEREGPSFSPSFPCRAQQVTGAVFVWLEGFSDGDVIAESSLPTHAQPAWGTPAGKRGRVRGRRAEGRRRGHQGSISHRPETEAAPREQADLRPSLLGTRVEPGMWGYLSLMPIFLAVWAISGVWIV
ncbi:hypothetical protein H8959_005631 [Pygathrix nigripes]